jgi:hypothetical protein
LPGVTVVVLLPQPIPACFGHDVMKPQRCGFACACNPPVAYAKETIRDHVTITCSPTTFKRLPSLWPTASGPCNQTCVSDSQYVTRSLARSRRTPITRELPSASARCLERRLFASRSFSTAEASCGAVSKLSAVCVCLTELYGRLPELLAPSAMHWNEHAGALPLLYRAPSHGDEVLGLARQKGDDRDCEVITVATSAAGAQGSGGQMATPTRQPGARK